MTHEEVAKYISNPLSSSHYYHLTFSDNGIGFETKYADQIFEVFKRLHGRTAYPGSGIGLALCKRIVGNHNGHIYVVSEVGFGTTFHLILPDKSL
jgi:signal transduction histidine kinase